jgi:hypothetical protein
MKRSSEGERAQARARREMARQLLAPARMILAALRSSPGGLSRSQVRRRVFSDNVPAGQVREWLDSLLAGGLVRLETAPTAGREAHVFFAEAGPRQRRRR